MYLKLSLKSLPFMVQFLLTLNRWKDIPDRTIMLVSRTNNYGLSWAKPLRILLLINLVFFMVLSILISDVLRFQPSVNWDNFKYTTKHLWSNNKLYIQLLDPTRKFSSVYQMSDIPTAVYWLDSLQKLILGIFLFQIIKGFRKYVSR